MKKTKTKSAASAVPVVEVQLFVPSVLMGVEQIRPGRNPRKYFDAEGMAGLVASVRQQGIQCPLLVRPLPEGESNGQTHELVFGERRLRAAKEVGMVTVPVMVRSLTDVEALELTVLENLQRADVRVTEEADGMAMLMAEGGLHDGDLGGEAGKEPAACATAFASGQGA